MKKQLKELQDLIIEMIKNEEYKVLETSISGDYFGIKIEIEGTAFHYSIPSGQNYLCEHSNVVILEEETGDRKDVAKILYKRHLEPVRNQKIQEQIAELQKQLK